MHANITAKKKKKTKYQTELKLVKRIEVLTEIITLQHNNNVSCSFFFV